MVDSIKGVNTLKSCPPQQYAKYEYEVEIDGKKQMANVEKKPDGKVTIKVGNGEDVKVINTDVKGLMKFNQKHQQNDILYSSKPTDNSKDKKEVCSGRLAQILKNLALAQMALGVKSNQHLQDLTNQQILLNQQMLQQQMLQQQIMQDNFTAMQFSTPGFGII